MGFFQRLKQFFTPAAPSPKVGGFISKARARWEEMKRERAFKRSQKRQAKMEKAQRKAEEAAKKRADEQKKRDAHEKAAETFMDRWGFNRSEYERFIQFMESVPDDLKEAFSSGSLVEAFRKGRSLGLSPDDMKVVLNQTYSDTEGTQEDLVNDLYMNMSAYAEYIKERSYV